MNSISYAIKPDDQPHFYPNVFKIVIDGIETDYYFDVAGLEMSHLEGGVFPMLVCGCGYVGCTGYYVKVDVSEKEVVWSKFYESFYDYGNPDENEEIQSVDLIKNSNIEDSVDISPPLRFPRGQYDSLIKEIMIEMKKYEEQQKEYENSLRAYKAGDRFHA